jgi:hypothetical protein
VTRAVWKFEAPILDRFALAMPKGAEIVSVQVQRGVPCAWALVDPKARLEVRTFHWVGTGHEHPVAFWSWLRWRGTVQLEEGALVFHLFEHDPA